MMTTYEVTYIRDDGLYKTAYMTAESVAECKRKIIPFGKPVRVYRGGNLIWSAHDKDEE